MGDHAGGQKRGGATRKPVLETTKPHMSQRFRLGDDCVLSIRVSLSTWKGCEIICQKAKPHVSDCIWAVIGTRLPFAKS